MATTEQYVGQPMLRKEDAKLLTGQGTFVDNQTMAGMVWMELVRPPYVHATIDRIDTSAAAAMPGVIAVLTAADLEDAFPGGLPMVWPITEDIKVPTHWPLTKDSSGSPATPSPSSWRRRARRPRTPPRPSSSRRPSCPSSSTSRRPRRTRSCSTRTSARTSSCTGATAGAATSRCFESAPVIVQERYEQPRLIPNAIEAPGCLAYGIPAAGEFTL